LPAKQESGKPGTRVRIPLSPPSAVAEGYGVMPHRSSAGAKTGRLASLF